MDLSSIFSRIGNSFRGENITDTLIATRNQLRDGAQEAIALCIKDTANIDFSKNPEYNSTLATVRRHYGKDTLKLNLFQSFGYILQRCDHELSQLIDLSGHYFTEEVDKDSLTYQRTTIISLGETIDFVATFIPRYTRYVIAKQTELSGGEKVEKALTRAQLNYIKENTLAFYKALSTVAKSDTDIKVIVKSIPEVVVSDDASRMFDERKLNPTGATSRFVSATFNPFYYIGMAIVQWQHSRYTQAKTEAETIKIELEALNAQARNGQVDALTERQQDMARERLSKLEAEIASYEKKALNTVY